MVTNINHYTLEGRIATNHVTTIDALIEQLRSEVFSAIEGANRTNALIADTYRADWDAVTAFYKNNCSKDSSIILKPRVKAVVSTWKEMPEAPMALAAYIV
jgi:hypothetical protein